MKLHTNSQTIDLEMLRAKMNSLYFCEYNFDTIVIVNGFVLIFLVTWAFSVAILKWNEKKTTFLI